MTKRKTSMTNLTDSGDFNRLIIKNTKMWKFVCLCLTYKEFYKALAQFSLETGQSLACRWLKGPH